MIDPAPLLPTLAVSLILPVLLITMGIGLFLNWRFAWWLAIACHCFLVILVLVAYVYLVYTLIEDWEGSNRFATGSPTSLAFATMIFVVVQTLAAIPLVILIRNPPDSRIASANASHEV